MMCRQHNLKGNNEWQCGQGDQKLNFLPVQIKLISVSMVDKLAREAIKSHGIRI